ncbi:MAG TPA: LacI family transcriptional regulator [Bacteroides sp.]|mgnify:CR=1 FL=1|nr:LacI family transcriptional regulator [Bacteroides sp.]
MQRIRIKDIAEIARVSIGTVDRVIHNRGEVSDATREKIQKLLREYNYKPDFMASSLALKREIRLAVVMPKIVNEHVFWKLPRKGIDRALDELSHYHLQVEHFNFDQIDRKDFLKLVNGFPFEQLHGVLFAPVFQKESVEFLEQCGRWNLPVVLFNSMLESPAVRSFVGQDAFHSGMVAARLIDYGMLPGKDVLIMNLSARKDHYAHIIQREKGFRSFFEEHGGRPDHLLTIDLNGAGDHELEERLEEAFARYEIAGIFVTNSRVHLVAGYLASRGIMNIRLVGYDLLPESIEYLKRDYIDFLISQRPEEQAFRGLTSLFNLVAFNREPERKQFLPIDIITRENLAFYEPKSQH